ncbi:unnamed protein product [Brugia pahangi]|uniref:Uncharacterized protein n=1 Tax=Brugia pahangi TaxID=6280 RepID=A0A0N4TZV7_BRUPA|nr:unnamed protein product [Brugia pahangi]
MIDEHTGMGGGELDCDEGTSSPLNNISTNEHLTSLIAHMANNTRTQCPECGKHFRKGFFIDLFFFFRFLKITVLR